MTDRNAIIGPLMIIIEAVIRKDMEELGVPPHLRPNCLWAVKKYMRKSLRDLTDTELEAYRDFLRSVAGTEAQLTAMLSLQPELLLTDDLQSLIRSAIKGYLNYKKANRILGPAVMGKPVKLD
jgi:hypothetical protein